MRAWHHVLDALSGYLRLAQELWSGDPKHAGAWNFGPDQRGIRTVGEVVESLAGFWGPGASWERDHAEHPAEAMLLGLDSRKARERLGYRPRLGFLEALEWTVRWYKSFSAGEDMRRFTEAQINRYAKLEPLS